MRVTVTWTKDPPEFKCEDCGYIYLDEIKTFAEQHGPKDCHPND